MICAHWKRTSLLKSSILTSNKLYYNTVSTSVRSSRRFRPELGLYKYLYQYSMTDRGRGVPGTSTGADSRMLMSWYHDIRSRRGGAVASVLDTSIYHKFI